MDHQIQLVNIYVKNLKSCVVCVVYIIVTFDVYIYPKGNQEIFPNGLSEVKTGTFTNELHTWHYKISHYTQ